jgi:hypothetical protein
MKSILVICFAFFLTHAHAETWIKTFGNEIAVEYIDTDSIKKSDNKATANFKRDYIDKVTRKSQDKNGKYFAFTQSRTTMMYECNGNKRAIEQLWDVSADGKTVSETKSYPLGSNNDTWDKAAMAVICK